MQLSRKAVGVVVVTLLVGSVLSVPTVRKTLGRIVRQQTTRSPQSPAAESWKTSRTAVPPDAAASGPNGAQAWRFEQLDEAIRASLTPGLGMKRLEVEEAKVAALPIDVAPLDELRAKDRLAYCYVLLGPADLAVPLYDDCVRLAQQLGDREQLRHALKGRAVAHLRVAERTNCVKHHNSESCLFPISPAAVHVDPRGAQGAAADLLSVLEITPADEAAIWLLNVVHMTLGTYPDAVPERFRIAPSAFESEADIGRFEEIAAKLGANSFSLAGGAITDDFDGDGRLDLLTSTMDSSKGLRLLHNRGDGTLDDVSAACGIDGIRGGLQIVHGDVNNDGRLDVLVLRGAWMGSYGRQPTSLLVQQADGTFVDVTEKSGVEVLAPTQTGAFADIDNDGDLDLYIGHEQDREDPAGEAFPSNLFRNRGDGTFEDITVRAGVTNDGYCKGVAFGDFDGDGFQDLHVSNLKEPNRLYRNRGDGTFVDVAAEVGATQSGSFATWFFDYDNDGDADLFNTHYRSPDPKSEVGAYYRLGTVPAKTCKLFENDGHGKFRDVTKERRLDRVMFPMGASFGDVDNDGWIDLYLATGNPDLDALWPNVLLRNDGGKRFQDITASSRTGHLQKGHGVAFGDLDNDGDQDFMVQTGGQYRDDAFWDAVFLNPGNTNHWITIRLAGTRSNRFGVGARVRVRIADAAAIDGHRDVHALVGSTSSFGGNSLQQELGLGQATSIEEIEVVWPASGTTQRFTDVPLDSIVRITEGGKELERLDSPAVRFP